VLRKTSSVTGHREGGRGVEVKKGTVKQVRNTNLLITAVTKPQVGRRLGRKGGTAKKVFKGLIKGTTGKGSGCGTEEPHQRAGNRGGKRTTGSLKREEGFTEKTTRAPGKATTTSEITRWGERGTRKFNAKGGQKKKRF